MSAIGSINFDVEDGLDSGIALLLVRPPEEEIIFKYNDCIILASPDTKYVLCRFNGVISHEDTYRQGVIFAQEALDILSMTGCADLITKDIEDEYFAWWGSSSSRTFILVSTVTLSYKLGMGHITVKDCDGNVVPPNHVIPKHHIGFRFFRLSQASDDLYDAYRNMYLAFESLLSSRYPKSKGLEIDWLRHSLTAASTDLALAKLALEGTPDLINYILNIIYDGARLPLFHAKDGKSYFAPAHNPSEREGVVKALTMLTDIVTRMADVWYSTRRRRGWVNLEVIDERNRELFSGTNFIFSGNPAFTQNDDLDNESIRQGDRFSAIFNENHESERRHNISGKMNISSSDHNADLNTLYLANDKHVLLYVTPQENINLKRFNIFRTIVFIREKNASMPKYIYQR